MLRSSSFHLAISIFVKLFVSCVIVCFIPRYGIFNFRLKMFYLEIDTFVFDCISLSKLQGSFWAMRTDRVIPYEKIIGIRTTGYGFISRVSDLSDVLFDQELLHISYFQIFFLVVYSCNHSEV